MTYTIEEIDIPSLSDDELEPLLGAINLLDREAEPRAVALTLAELRLFADSPGWVQHRFGVYADDGQLAGVGQGRYPDDGTMPRVVMCSIRVLPEHRWRGAGTLMLGHLCDIADDLDRDRLQSFFHDTVPAGEAFSTAIGATESLDFHQNVVRIADLDRSLLAEWATLGQERARGYSVRLFDGSIPEELHSDLAHLFYVLERDAPFPDEFEPRVWNADRVTQMQEHFLKGTDLLAALAFDESGTAVGMSQLIRRKTDPTTWIVTVTMVDPDHRGQSLGKWVKGTVNMAALERWDGGVYQETGNAFTNDAMLAINHAMGFKHEFTMTNCSIKVADARTYLASKGRSAARPRTRGSQRR